MLELEERNAGQDVTLEEAQRSTEADAAAFDKERQVLQERVQMLTGLMGRIVGQQRWFCDSFDRDMANKVRFTSRSKSSSLMALLIGCSLAGPV